MRMLLSTAARLVVVLACIRHAASQSSCAAAGNSTASITINGMGVDTWDDVFVVNRYAPRPLFVGTYGSYVLWHTNNASDGKWIMSSAATTTPTILGYLPRNTPTIQMYANAPVASRWTALDASATTLNWYTYVDGAGQDIYVGPMATVTFSCAAAQPPRPPPPPTPPPSPPTGMSLDKLSSIPSLLGRVSHRWFGSGEYPIRQAMSSTSCSTELRGADLVGVSNGGVPLVVRGGNCATLPGAPPGSITTIGTAGAFTSSSRFSLLPAPPTGGASFLTQAGSVAVVIWTFVNPRNSLSGGPAGVVLFNFSTGSGTPLSLSAVWSSGNTWGQLRASLPGCPSVDVIPPPGMPHHPSSTQAGGTVMYGIGLDPANGMIVAVNGVPYALNVSSCPRRNWGTGSVYSGEPGTLSFSTGTTGSPFDYVNSPWLSSRYYFLDYYIAPVGGSAYPNDGTLQDILLRETQFMPSTVSSPPPPFVSSTGLLPTPITACVPLLTHQYIGLLQDPLVWQSAPPAPTGSLPEYIPFNGAEVIDRGAWQARTAPAQQQDLANAFFSSPNGLPPPGSTFIPATLGAGVLAMGKMTFTAQAGASMRVLVGGVLGAAGNGTAAADVVTFDFADVVVNINATGVNVTNVATGAFAGMNTLLALTGGIRPGNGYLTVVLSKRAVSVFVGRTKVFSSPAVALPTVAPGASATTSETASSIYSQVAFSYSGALSIFDVQIYGNVALRAQDVAELATGGQSCSTNYPGYTQGG